MPVSGLIEDLESQCQGWPLPHEYREWWHLFQQTRFVSVPARIIAFIRWRAAGSPIDQLPPGVPSPQLPPPEDGPGTELHKLIAALGITPDASCGCEAMRLQMNRWGVDGCREHRAEILEHLRKAYSKTDWATVLRAGTAAASMGIFSIEGLLDEALRLNAAHAYLRGKS